MKVAVYPGSFDPLHVGHQAIMEYLTREAGFDCVYLIVSHQNPFKDPEKAISARRRYEDALSAVARHPELQVRVDDIELQMPPPHYTIRTLDALRAREPENDFSLVIGADNLSRFADWRESARLISDYGLVVFPRTGFDSEALREELLQHFSEVPREGFLHHPSAHSAHSAHSDRSDCSVGSVRIRLIDAPLVDISSTTIREALSRGEDVSRWLM